MQFGLDYWRRYEKIIGLDCTGRGSVYEWYRFHMLEIRLSVDYIHSVN